MWYTNIIRIRGSTRLQVVLSPKGTRLTSTGNVYTFPGVTHHSIQYMHHCVWVRIHLGYTFPGKTTYYTVNKQKQSEQHNTVKPWIVLQ